MLELYHKVGVTFVLTQRAQYGQVIKIVGNGTELSNWTPSEAENMTWTTGNVWAYSVVCYVVIILDKL